ncbi:MAG: hypothetical protein ACC642_06950, partial [Pseudomonadales bacterium]
QGSFESALPADPDDDHNYNPCNPETGDCATHADPHIEIQLALTLDQDDELSAAFYRSTSQFRSAKTLDLLGRSCGTRVGGLENIERGDEGISWIARFDLSVENRSCLGKLRPTSSHFLLIRGLKQEDDTAPRVEVAIDKRIVNNNYLIVKEDGVERRVRLDLNNTQGTGRRARYRVCIEDDLGDFGRCVVTDKKLRQFAFPLPVPGGVAMNYTWWYDLVPNLKRTRDLYELEQYVARFERAQQ